MQAPQAPNPIETAQAQGNMNKDTAIAQQGLNLVDQKGPYGSVTNSQVGTWADGTPKFQQTTTLDPAQQDILNKQNQLGGNLAQLGVDQSQRLGGILNTPFNLNNDATESRLMELGRQRLDPLLSQRRESTEQSLFNRGARPGSEAYRRGMEAVTQGENDAYNQLLLTGRGQAVNEALTERNQPINEIMAIAGGSQVQQPQFGATPQSGIAPVDYAGLVNSNYNQQNQQYQNTWNGIGNLAGAIGGWAFSDELLKDDIQDTGLDTPDGIDIKTYRYKGSPMMQLGVIAQEAEKVRPDAVRTHPSGFKQVNYDKIMGA